MARREYDACSHIKRRPTAINVDEGFLETIKQEARVLPLFEERIHNFKYSREYSFNNNDTLRCRWIEFTTARKPKIPFKFPSVKDMHFINNTVMHEPKETINQRENHRFHLRSGPGIDKFGQLPIPNEMHLRKTTYRDIRDKKEMEKTGEKNWVLTQALELPHSKDENVLPLFERKVSNYKRMKLCSLETNEALRCRWNSYVNHIEGLKHSPFQFPKIGDLHFYNCGIKFMPSLTPVNRASFRRQMAIGPGVDKFGQIPIPCDMHVTKCVAKPKTEPIKSSKAKKH